MILLDVANQAARMARILVNPGQGLNASQQAEFLHLCNALLDGIKIERWFFYYILRTEFPVVAAQKDYTIGDASLGADWVVERPEKVLRAGILTPGSRPEQPSEIPIKLTETFEEYARIVNKLTQSTYPQVLYYQASLPLGTGTLWPVPSRSVEHQIVLYTPQTVQEFDDINGEYIVPKGYREYMEYACALAWHDRYPHLPLSSNIPAKAAEYKARVEAQQWTPSFTKSDDGACETGRGLPSWVFNGRVTLP